MSCFPLIGWYTVVTRFMSYMSYFVGVPLIGCLTIVVIRFMSFHPYSSVSQSLLIGWYTYYTVVISVRVVYVMSYCFTLIRRYPTNRMVYLPQSLLGSCRICLVSPLFVGVPLIGWYTYYTVVIRFVYVVVYVLFHPYSSVSH